MKMLNVTLTLKSHSLEINGSCTEIGAHKFVFKRLKDPHYLDLEEFWF